MCKKSVRATDTSHPCNNAPGLKYWNIFQTVDQSKLEFSRMLATLAQLTGARKNGSVNINMKLSVWSWCVCDTWQARLGCDSWQESATSRYKVNSPSGDI